MNKIVCIVRTLNEERNIERFCKNYQWTDKILVADGGSSDDTVKIAVSMPKTEVRSFHKKKQMENGLWRNPEAEHLNFLTKWAEDEDADWILQDDCDCFPNYKLKQDARGLLKETQFDFVYAVRLYLWKGNTHFPLMAKPDKSLVGILNSIASLSRNQRIKIIKPLLDDIKWKASLWGWRATLNIRFEDTDMAYTWKPKIDSPDERLNLLPPYCLMHTSWVDERELRERLNWYHKSGQIPNIKHPLEYAGPIEKLPEWASEWK